VRAVPTHHHHRSRAQHFSRAHEGSKNKKKPQIPRGLIEAGVVLVFCIIFVLFVVSHARQASATYDETTHLPAGYSYWLWNDYRMNPEHPPLVKKIAALPLLWLRVWPPKIDLTEQDAPGTIPVTLLMAKRSWVLGLADINAQWIFGHSILYGVRAEPLRKLKISEPLLVPTTATLEKYDFFNDADQMMFWGRMPIMMLGVLLAILVFFWARELYGLAGGVLALALFCFDPNFIAHSGLVTTDVGVTVFMFGAVYFLWRVCRRIEMLSFALMLLFFGAAFASKYTAVLLVPMFLLVGAGRIFSSKDWVVGAQGRYRFSTRTSKAVAFCGIIVAASAAAYAMIWMAYGFRYSAAADPAQAAAAEKLVLPAEVQATRELGRLPIENVVRRTAAIKSLTKDFPQGPPEQQIQETMGSVPIGLSGEAILFAKDGQLLPEAYIYGFAYAQMKSLIRGSFLLGEYSNRGFWYYFPVTFLLKTPLLTLAAIVAAFVFAVRRKELWRSRLAFFVIPVGVYFLASITSSLNIGHRHLLPIYPFLFVLCGGLALEWANWKRQSKKELGAVVALGAIAVSSFVVFAPPWKPAVVYPHYLAYFNELAGGPRNGHRALVDSNLDWGQDLKTLKDWLEEKQINEPINLCYFGMADPRYYQIPHVKLPGGYAFEPPLEETFAIAKIPGYVAISATNLQGVYFSPQGREAWKYFLRRATLVDQVGYSIFIYRLDQPPQ
jgi:hypothetical protein